MNPIKIDKVFDVKIITHYYRKSDIAVQKLVAAILFLAMHCVALSEERDKYEPSCWGDWQRWGQQTDSTYFNPLIPADFSDIDCIEHDGYFYAISSTFQFEPGMVILRSTDMINWDIISHAVPDITEISEAMDWTQMNRYARGIWAGAIRYHKGLFYVYFGCPDEGMFMTTSEKIDGPWAPLTKMNIGKGWDDCCPLFDDDAKNYFVATHFADGYKTYIFPLSDDGKEVDWERKVLINEGFGREASKLYKWSGMYYHLFSEHRDGGRYLVMQRSDNPMGPYNQVRRLCHTQSEWNEPNQGGYLQDKAGNWFFLTHHGKGDWGGRQVSLLPVCWTDDGWPVIGIPGEDGIGKMSWNNPMPVPFRGSANGKDGSNGNVAIGFGMPDWEWNYHPRKDFYIREDSTLILKAFMPLERDNLLKAGNTLTLRSYQVPFNEAVVAIDLSGMTEGQRSGICHFSKSWSEFGVMMDGGRRILYHKPDNDVRKVLMEDIPEYIMLRSHWGLDGLCHYSYSPDGNEWTEFGPLYQLRWGNYRGDRLGLFTYNNEGEHGQATFSRFSYRSSDNAEPLDH